jgi:hypothetical protein
MADPEGSLEGIRYMGSQFSNFADFFYHFEFKGLSLSLNAYGYSRRIIAPVFQAPESFNNDTRSVSFTAVTDYSAHFEPSFL